MSLKTNGQAIKQFQKAESPTQRGFMKKIYKLLEELTSQESPV
jgi:hypothetical protein